jgi:hypothetical protein
LLIQTEGQLSNSKGIALFKGIDFEGGAAQAIGRGVGRPVTEACERACNELA